MDRSLQNLFQGLVDEFLLRIVDQIILQKGIGDGDIELGHFIHQNRHLAGKGFIGIADLGISYIPINENFNYNPPLKTFEYLACGLPLIATRTVSNCRIIKNGFNGILINDTPDDISNSIINLLQDKKMQAVLKKNARKSIMDFDFEYTFIYYLIRRIYFLLVKRIEPV